jgi:sortase A
MTLYRYTKSRKTKLRKVISFVSFVSTLTGIGLLIFVLYPILSFELIYAPRYQGLIRPIPGEIIKDTFIGKLPQVLGADNTDYTKASAWFPNAPVVQIESPGSEYYLSIPKVGISNATVIPGSDDLSKSLIQFAGPPPGKKGNLTIFGHSTLLWFYNPKDYKAIFSKLPELIRGDEIIITYDNITYAYKVVEMKVVAPDDFSVLDQNYDEIYLTLVTCVPPGTYLKRLAVKAVLVN